MTGAESVYVQTGREIRAKKVFFRVSAWFLW